MKELRAILASLFVLMPWLTLADMMQFDNNSNDLGALDIDVPLWDTITLDEAIQFLENTTDEFNAIPSIGIGNVYSNDGPLGFVSGQVYGYSAKWGSSMSSKPIYTGPDNLYANWRTMNVSGIQGPGLNLHTALCLLFWRWCL